MLCCFRSSDTANIDDNIDEQRPILRSITSPPNYHSLFAVPYAHVIRDDEIQLVSPALLELNNKNTYWLFNDASSNEVFATECFSYDDTNTSAPVVIATRATDGQLYFEHILKIEPVNATNSAASMRINSNSTVKSMESSTIPMSHPFDEFLMNPVNPIVSQDVKTNSTVPKSDNQ